MDDDYQKYLSNIIRLLEKNAPKRLSISAISREIGINRIKTVKYMDMLEMIGVATMVPYGMSKLYSISKRVPYSNLLDAYSDAIVILDDKGHVEMVNNKFFAMFNLNREKDIVNTNLVNSGLNVFSALPIKNNITRIIRGSPYEDEIQYIDEGTGRIYLLKFIPTVSDSGTMSTMIAVGDITNQKSREEKYMILDQKLRTIFESARIGIMFIDANGKVININKASIEMLGLDPAQSMAGMDISKLLGTEDWKRMKNNFITEADIACDFNDTTGNRMRSKAGVTFFEITCAPIRSGIKEDLIIEYAILLRDITMERNVIVEVNKNESRYRSFFKNTCNGMFISQLTEDGKELLFKDLNRAAERILQVKNTDVIGKKIVDVFPDTREVDLKDLYDKVVYDGIPQYFPPVQYRKGLHEPWFSHYMFKLPSNEVASFIINVTEGP